MCQCVFVCLCAMILVRIGKIGLKSNRRPSHMCFCPFECLSVCAIVFVLCLFSHLCVCIAMIKVVVEKKWVEE